MSYDPDEEGPRFLSVPSPSPRNSSSKHTLSRNRSNASLRGGTSSLAHELAAALLPEPTSGSRLLAEEFGLDYDEGAEGIDGLPPEDVDGVPTFAVSGDLDPSVISDGVASGSTTPAATEDDEDEDNDDDIPDVSTHPNTLPPRTRRQRHHQHQHQHQQSPPPQHPQPNHAQPEADAMALLSQNLESTEKFIAHLRRLDTDGSATLTLETLAVDIISRLNDTVRDREEQVRELLQYEREFQRIAAEVGGSDALASLDALEDPRGLLLADASSSSSSSSAPLAPASSSTARSTHHHLDPVAEESSFAHDDWEVDPDAHLQPDGDPDASADIDLDLDLIDGIGSNSTSPIKDDSFASSMLPSSPPPPLPMSSGSATPAGAIPHLAHLRTHTTSLVSSLSSLSEHAQVNGAATTEAGRKLRALKNRLGGWLTDLDSAERSRLRIERWEADGDVEGARRVDGRTVVAEHLREFERVLFEANAKAQAIMAPA